jgi:predicted ATPase
MNNELQTIDHQNLQAKIHTICGFQVMIATHSPMILKCD